MINEYDEGAVTQISTVLGYVYGVTNFGNTKSIRVIFFFKMLEV